MIPVSLISKQGWKTGKFQILISESITDLICKKNTILIQIVFSRNVMK